uniref:Uncharacterized protein n=1 Tax=Scleropages formosus TaxID=113540 RepID=A0A8C9SG15_SCLFO
MSVWSFLRAPGYGGLTLAALPLEVDVTPLAIVDLLVAGLHLDAAGAHVHEQVEEAIEQLDGEVVGLELAVGTLLLGALQAAVAEEQQAAGLRGAEVEGDGACLLGVPPGEGDVGLGGLEGDRVKGCDVLAAEHQVPVQADLGVSLDGQAGQLQLEVIVLVDHLRREAACCASVFPHCESHTNITQALGPENFFLFL